MVSELFNLQNGSNMDGSYNYEECTGLRVRPRRGDGLLFYSLFHNGTIDPVSICPTIDIILSNYLLVRLECFFLGPWLRR